MGSALKLATFPLRRRLIGAAIMLAGVLMVLLGFFVSIGSGPVHGSITVPLQHSQALQIPLSSDNAALILKHAFDHPLFSANTVRQVSDAALRGGVILMAAGGALALLTLLIPPLRGFAGLAAGIGLFGDAALSGVLVGENTRLSVDFSHNPQVHVDLGAAVWVFAAGFAVILVGGALAAWRPLAGLFTGISLALTGAGLGAVLALVVGGNHLVTALVGH